MTARTVLDESPSDEAPAHHATPALVGREWQGHLATAFSIPFPQAFRYPSAQDADLRTLLASASSVPNELRAAFVRGFPLAALAEKAEWKAARPVVLEDEHLDDVLGILRGLVDRAERSSRRLHAAGTAAAAVVLADVRKPLALLAARELQRLSVLMAEAGKAAAAMDKSVKKVLRGAKLADLVTAAVKTSNLDQANALIAADMDLRRMPAWRMPAWAELLEKTGALKEAEGLLRDRVETDDTLMLATRHLRLLLALGDRDAACDRARAMCRAAERQSPRRLDRLRVQVADRVKNQRISRIVGRLLDAEGAKRRLRRAQNVGRAALALGDVELMRKTFRLLAQRGPRRFDAAEAGGLILAGDNAQAERVIADFIGRRERTRRRITSSGAAFHFGELDQIIDLALLLQQGLLNEGRDPTFLGSLERLVSTVTEPRRVAAGDESRAFSIVLATLRLRVRGVTVDTAAERRLTANALRLARGHKERLQVGQLLADAWRSEGTAIQRSAFIEMLAQFEASVAKALAGAQATAEPVSLPPPLGTTDGTPAAFGLAVDALDPAICRTLAKQITSLLSVAERLLDEASIARLDRFAVALLDVAVERNWVGHPAFVGMAFRMTMTCPDISAPLRFLGVACAANPRNSSFLRHFASATMATGDNRVLSHIAEELRRRPHDETVLRLAATGYANSQDLPSALAANKTLCDHAKSMAITQSEDSAHLKEFFALRSATDMQRFWIDTTGVLGRVPAPRSASIKGVVFASYYNCTGSAAMTTLPFLELKRRGYDIVFLNNGTVTAEATGHAVLDRFSGILQNNTVVQEGLTSNPAKLFHRWRIAPGTGIIEVDGLDFYQTIYERIVQQSGTYSIDFDAPHIRRHVHNMVRMLDRGLYVARRVRDEVAARGIPVRFVSSNWQYPPYSAFRIACAQWGKDCDINFVAASSGYEHYFTNLGTYVSTTAAVVNMTKNRTTRTPFFPVPQAFRDWYRANAALVESSYGEIRSWIMADRSGVGSKITPEASLVRDRILAHRARGGKVICAFGKVLRDLAVPYDGGPGHRNLKDFVNHLVECAGRSDALVLIKPHPHELRFEIAGQTREHFTDLIQQSLPPNVIVLGHRWFNIRDLIQLIDLGVLWNGTAALELGASGVPVLMCDHWGVLDHPVGHRAPRDRSHFEAIIRDPMLVTTDAEYAKRCAGLLKYLSTDNVMRPCAYVRRGLLAVDVGAPVWQMDAVERFMREGDPYVAALADDFMF